MKARQNPKLLHGGALFAGASVESLRGVSGYDRGAWKNARDEVSCYRCAVRMLVAVLFIVIGLVYNRSTL